MLRRHAIQILDRDKKTLHWFVSVRANTWLTDCIRSQRDFADP